MFINCPVIVYTRLNNTRAIHYPAVSTPALMQLAQNIVNSSSRAAISRCASTATAPETLVAFCRRNESINNKAGLRRAYFSKHSARYLDHSQQNRQGWTVLRKVTPDLRREAIASMIPRNRCFQMQAATGLNWKTFQSQFWENIQQRHSKTSVLNATSSPKENAHDLQVWHHHS